ncbi:hypothetical protein TRVA0_007S01882 [Trichomonascus vanleenenianus]|uniref:uncharacterized protein n=1 Tax=Trichomonascus vanleenenianus TaxID=2268995 RepID=UPI003ECBADFE
MPKEPNSNGKATAKVQKKSRSYQPGQRRFYCKFPDCAASFARQEHLKRHNSVHDKSISFVCDYCNRSFARKDILTRHVRRQHENDKTRNYREPNGKATGNNSTDEAGEPETTRYSHMQVVHGMPTTEPLPHALDKGFDYMSPNFSDNTASPDAILGNSNQVVSQLLNDDFMNWLFTTHPSPTSVLEEDRTAPDSYVYQNSIFQSMDVLSTSNPVDFELPEYRFEKDQKYSVLSHTGYQQPPHLSPNAQISNVPPTTAGENVSYQPKAEIQPQQLPPPNTLPSISSISGSPTSTVSSQQGPLSASSATTPALPAATSSESYRICTRETCEKIRRAMAIEPSPLSDKFLNPGFITYAIDIYWSLHMRWPILHRPSFSLNHAPPLLLVSMITIAMYLTRDDDAIELAVMLHETLRYKVYVLPEFKAPAAMWVFQTLLLAEIFEKMASTEEQHDMATRFHDVLIASMRRGSTSSTVNAESWRFNTNDKSSQDPEWLRFIDHESRKRIAFFAFVVDTQHTALFNHPPSMFISDLRFRLPCDEALWEAPDGDHWRQIKDSFPPPPHFTTTISAFLKFDHHSQPQLSPWSMMVILHGLISVGWNMRLRESILSDQIGAATSSGSTKQQASAPAGSTSHGSETTPPITATTTLRNGGGHGAAVGDSKMRNKHQLKHHWVRTISESYYGWLRHYRITFIINGKLSFNHPYLLGCLTTYEFAHIILNSDIQELQSYVAHTSTVRALRSSPDLQQRRKVALQREQSANAIRHWMFTAECVQAVTHALDLIDMFLLGENTYDVTKETAFHRTWCLYVAAIVVWVFEHFSASFEPPSLPPAADQPSTIPPDMRLRQYLGKIRATLAKSDIRTAPASSASSDDGTSLDENPAANEAELVTSRRHNGDLRAFLADDSMITSCEANILLQQVYNLLEPCRWGVMINRLKNVRNILL